ncbi:PREDICTED: protein RALF-like 17 [Camelina sativa]|uniref:Protein RALF-like 17 n=1 Tax=Camelina sativa TaxID=90675 RepID=A0ABM0Z3M8_CAMSA|nr:PREDICTED: protein RALF-like 17 [Camelina sativa]
MAASREFIICCFLTLLLCNFFMRGVDSGGASVDVNRGGCGGGDGSLGDDNERCVDQAVLKDDDDDDVDDVYKVINKMRIYA